MKLVEICLVAFHYPNYRDIWGICVLPADDASPLLAVDRPGEQGPLHVPPRHSEQNKRTPGLPSPPALPLLFLLFASCCCCFLACNSMRYGSTCSCFSTSSSIPPASPPVGPPAVAAADVPAAVVSLPFVSPVRSALEVMAAIHGGRREDRPFAARFRKRSAWTRSLTRSRYASMFLGDEHRRTFSSR